MRNLPFFALLLGLAALSSSPVDAQSLKNSQSLELSGLAYVDYAYALSVPDGDAGDNGFGYRRLYLTSDYRLADDMRVRARFEANDKTTNADGKPSPFVKDLYFRWDDALGDGHRLVIGISSPPAFGTAEGFFGYRSLEKTIMDRNKILSSRDFGVSISGPINDQGTLRYGLMVGNNNSVKREEDRNKRVYGQVQATPTDRLALTVGGDFAKLPGGSSLNSHAFIGYRLDAVRLGAEAYFNPIRPEDSVDELDRFGVSVFAAAEINEAVELLGRFDSFGQNADGETTSGWYALAGLAWSPVDNVRFIPNIYLNNALGADEASTTARVTLHVDF